MLTKELLEKFKSIYKQQFSIDLSDEETTLMATDFLNLMKILVSPDPEDTQIDKDKGKKLSEGVNHETQQI